MKHLGRDRLRLTLNIGYIDFLYNSKLSLNTVVVKYYHIFLEQLYILFVMFACILFNQFITVDTHFIIRAFHIVMTI